MPQPTSNNRLLDVGRPHARAAAHIQISAVAHVPAIRLLDVGSGTGVWPAYIYPKLKKAIETGRLPRDFKIEFGAVDVSQGSLDKFEEMVQAHDDIYRLRAKYCVDTQQLGSSFFASGGIRI